MILNTATSYTGDTRINDHENGSTSTLQLGVNGALPTTGQLRLFQNSVLDLNGKTQTLANIHLSATNAEIKDSSGTGAPARLLTLSAGGEIFLEGNSSEDQRSHRTGWGRQAERKCKPAAVKFPA